IDGTRAFIEGNPTWAISLAIADKGRITEAIVTLPMRGKTYAARLGKGARLNDLPIRTSANESLRQASILAARPTFDAWNWKDASPPPIKPQLRPSLAYRLALVGEGRFDAMLTLRATWEWDIAAGALIVREAGGIASDRRLQPLRFNSPTAQVNGVLAAGRGLYRALGRRLSQS
ncbi:MAG TPA: 3'(2'),5'-bisphosphate nucleotidase CysQ, partial [Rhodobacteraceae bacterium]|nr:3'(2'),5'-bisphosphate nucleotidase CysQ [Paracoccaceae bacterium]